MLIRCLVTQTNDPMGILKAKDGYRPWPVRNRYTDQRSDGDTERGVNDELLTVVRIVTQTNDPMGILKVVPSLGALSVRRRYTDQRSDGDTERGDIW